MTDSFELVRRYPWTPSLKDYYRKVESQEPIEFLKEVFEEYKNGELEGRVFTIFKEAFNNSEVITNYKEDELNVYAYIIMKILLSIFNNKPISNKVANLYSKHNYKLMLEQNSDVELYQICKDLHLDFKYDQDPIKYGLIIDKDQKESLSTHFRLSYIDYVNLMVNLRDDYRKLAHVPLQGGYVFIQTRELIRLLQEYVRGKVIPTSGLEKEAFLKIPQFKDLHDKILDEWELKKEKFEYSFDIKFANNLDLSKSFPPCIREIFKKVDEGQNIIHIERLFLVFFLHALEFPSDEITDIFSKLPDFDRKKTEYQVEFAKKKGYSPHSCSTLKSLNLCMAEKYHDEVCLEGYYSKVADEKRKIAHPLFYVQLKQYRKAYYNAMKKKEEKEDE
jgi:DNA primase large subunit